MYSKVNEVVFGCSELRRSTFHSFTNGRILSPAFVFAAHVVKVGSPRCEGHVSLRY